MLPLIWWNQFNPMDISTVILPTWIRIDPKQPQDGAKISAWSPSNAFEMPQWVLGGCTPAPSSGAAGNDVEFPSKMAPKIRISDTENIGVTLLLGFFSFKIFFWNIQKYFLRFNCEFLEIFLEISKSGFWKNSNRIFQIRRSSQKSTSISPVYWEGKNRCKYSQESHRTKLTNLKDINK